MCMYIHMYIYREGVNLWHDTFNQMYFRDAYTHLYDTGSCKYSFLWYDAAYTTWRNTFMVPNFLGCDASVSSFWCAIGLYYVC